MLPHPPRILLGHLPTPLAPLHHLSRRYGVELWIKRDDLTGSTLTGNKVRKLEYLLAEACDQQADVVLTCGGAQSNHCRATAIAARERGLDSVLFLRTDEPANPPPLEGNSLLDALCGAELRWISRAEWAERNRLMEDAAAELRLEGKTPYIIPEGGSNALGAWGYVHCVEELAKQLPPGPATLVYAAGSGGTGAGLLLGVRLLDLPWRVVGVNVCDNRDYFVSVIGEIMQAAAARWHLPLVLDPSEIEIVDGYVGAGYAQSRPEELVLIRDVARAEGIVLDPVYTGKAFYALTRELERNHSQFGERIVFMHTGGIFGLFAKTSELAALL